MATANLSANVAALARYIAQDQIAQDIEFNQKLQAITQATNQMLTLEAKVSELIQKGWYQSEVSDLTFGGTRSGNADAFTARLNALEQKVAELQQKAWTQEALTLTD